MLAVLGTVVAALLGRRTLNRTKRAKYATVARFGLQQRTAGLTFIIVQAGIRRHDFDLLVPAFRASQCGFWNWSIHCCALTGTVILRGFAGYLKPVPVKCRRGIVAKPRHPSSCTLRRCGPGRAVLEHSFAIHDSFWLIPGIPLPQGALRQRYGSVTARGYSRGLRHHLPWVEIFVSSPYP